MDFYTAFEQNREKDEDRQKKEAEAALVRCLPSCKEMEKNNLF